MKASEARKYAWITKAEIDACGAICDAVEFTERVREDLDFDDGATWKVIYNLRAEMDRLFRGSVVDYVEPLRTLLVDDAQEDLDHQAYAKVRNLVFREDSRFEEEFDLVLVLGVLCYCTKPKHGRVLEPAFMWEKLRTVS